MAENTNKTHETTEPQVEKLPRFKNFVHNLPRATKVFGLTAVAMTVAGVVIVVKNKNQDTDIDQAGTSEATFTSSDSETTPVTEA